MTLLVLADHHNRETGLCCPSQATIAEKAGLSRKHVNKCLAELELGGIISIIERTRDNGGNTSCDYVLHMPERAKTERVEPSGFIYILTAGGRTKVGIARNLENRIKTLSATLFDELEIIAHWSLPMRQARAMERLVLERFSAQRIKGEWLDVDPAEIEEVISEAIAGGLLPEVTPPLSPEVTPPVTTGDTKNQESNLEINNPPLPPEGAGKGFANLWGVWSFDHLPDNRDYAEKLFNRLSLEDREAAIEMARPYMALMAKRSKPQQMVPYLKERRFLELVGAPEIDAEGDFIIKPGCQEWREWMGYVRKKHGQSGVEYFIKTGFIVVKTRWPEGHPNGKTQQL